MGTEETISVWRGCALLHPDMTGEDSLWESQSSFTEAGGKAGEFVPQQTGPLSFRGMGTQTAGGSVTLKVQQPGFAGPTNRLAIVRKADTSSVYGGWNPPATARQVWAPAWNGSVSQESTYPHVAADKLGNVVCVYQEDNGGASYKIRSTTLDPATGSWGSPVDVYNVGGTAPLYDLRACVVCLDDGSFLCIGTVYDSVNSTVNLRTWRSADQGATWSVVSTFALDEPLDGSAATSGYAFQNPARIRAAFNPRTGQVVVLLQVELTTTATGNGTQTLQFMSSDGGLTMKAVVSAEYAFTSLKTTHHALADVAPWRDGFAVAIVDGVTATHAVRVARLANGFVRYSDAPYVEVVPSPTFYAINENTAGAINYVDDGDLAFWQDDAGDYFLAVTALNKTGDPVVMYRSRDSIQTFEAMGDGDRVSAGSPPGQVFDQGAGTIKPDRYAACAVRGSAIFVHNQQTPTSTVDNDLFAVRLGGWCSVEMPSLGLTNFDTRKAMWTRIGVPYEMPDGGNWTKTTTGGTATLVSAPAVNIDTTAQQLYYGDAPQGSLTEGVMAIFCCRVNSGGSIAANEVGVQILWSGGTVNEYEVQLRLSTTQARLVDAVGPTALGTVSVDMTGWVTFVIAMKAGEVKCWYREEDFTDDQEFAELASSTSIANRVLGGVGTNALRFGHLTNTTSDSDWRLYAFSSDQYVGFNATTQDEDDLAGRHLGDVNHPVYTIDGVSVAASGGPGREGDVFIAQAGSSHPWTNMLPMVNASPRVPFRTPTKSPSVASVAAQQFAFTVQPDLVASGQESRWPTDVLVVDLRGLNCRDVLIEGYYGAGWNTLADVTTVVASGQITREGKTVRFTGGSASSTNPYLGADTLAGGTVKLSAPSGIPAASVLRPILGNESGFMQPEANTKGAVIRMGDVTLPDPTSYADGEVWSPNLTVVIPLLGQELAAVRVTLKSQQTATNYLECGTMSVCYAVGLREWSNAWVWNHEPNSEIDEHVSGARRGRQRGPARRTVELAWVDPVNTTPSIGAGASPNFSKASGNSGALPFIVESETPHRIAEMVGQAAGGVFPGVFLPRVDYVENGGTDVQVFRLPSESMYGRCTSSARLEHVVGSEGNGSSADFIGPVYRVARQVWEEEV